MAQILLSSTCKASVGERQRERDNKGFRASGGYLQKNEKSGARASGGVGVISENAGG